MNESKALDAVERVRELHRSCDAEEIRLGSFDIIAAGAIPWRLVDGSLQVLLIHRPKYNDWSWPKGKLDEGESIAECAVREVDEEIGLQITLGLPLAATTYSVRQRTKVVYYWAAKVAPGTAISPDGGECDAVQWVAAKQAAQFLTNPADSAPLADLVAAHKAGHLAAKPFLLIRHAKAKPRGKWTRAEGERPLAATGRRQAQAVARLLEAWKPGHVASSPWMRCVQTVAPYVSAHALKLKSIRAVTEHAANRHPKAAARAVRKLLEKNRSQVLCTHRPVLPLALKVLAGHSSKQVARVLPEADPYLEPGSLIVAHHLPGSKERIISLEVHTPYHD
ncbi:ADP-ribose pyrophosphatase [Glutamicibacter uratoxydans]|uniref:ADP-ribose pyrophosphatase n=1 Tax=Glutamicibacter uratoxydans TaxID=43667 RepID=A0A4Y4DXH5_GLUUR|nr:NUDIX hydrolase [Glutamicibacter uratoxydans]GED07121.1 ADP-ribose pyrophosphatase [Glutamicibacter uratoxydans]